MAMNVGGGGGSGPHGDPDVVVDVNTTPLIDVMLVLLVMLIITIPIQTHAVKLDMPQANPPPTDAPPPPAVDLEIDFDGTVLWNGEPMDRRTLEANFRREAQAGDNQSEFHIRPNKLVEYKYVAAVLASAQRLGVTKVGIVGNEQFMQ
jgi:biopolymer transport protein ExbD